jgi:hypothetical protein
LLEGTESHDLRWTTPGNRRRFDGSVEGAQALENDQDPDEDSPTTTPISPIIDLGRKPKKNG